jgi:hypothetical protein
MGPLDLLLAFYASGWLLLAQVLQNYTSALQLPSAMNTEDFLALWPAVVTAHAAASPADGRNKCVSMVLRLSPAFSHQPLSS